MKKLTIILLFISANVFSAESLCKVVRTKYIFDGQEKTQSETICFIERFASSKECFPLVEKNCYFSNIDKKITRSLVFKKIGQPGFRLCHLLNGSPQLYEIYLRKKWIPFERCYAPDRHSFADIDELMRLYQSRF